MFPMLVPYGNIEKNWHDVEQYDELFKQFYAHLQSLGLIVNEGKIIDASFVVSPRQRNTREENKTIKKGEGNSLWNDNPHKKCHKDIDARWTKKGGEAFCDYKNHAKVCRKTKLIMVSNHPWNIERESVAVGEFLTTYIECIEGISSICSVFQ